MPKLLDLTRTSAMGSSEFAKDLPSARLESFRIQTSLSFPEAYLCNKLEISV
jgi:hypothetical protein